MTALGRTWAVCLVGLTGHLVEVEAHLAAGIPAFTLIGLPDAALAEARERVRAAVTSCGIGWPQRRTTVNLSPAGLPKAGAGFDLAVALAVLAAGGVVDAGRVATRVHLGELGLDGRLRPVRGVLPAVAAAVSAGRPDVVVPEASAEEAALVPGARVHAHAHLAQVLRSYGADCAEPPEVGGPVDDRRPAPAESAPDLADVLGQAQARHALEVAAAGAHHLLMVGPPGTGKTMLASRLPGLLPDLTDEQAVEVTAVHSLAGTFDPRRGLLRRPPFESPHHTATPAAVIGGGSGVPRPGAASRAHRGVLFIDEAPEASTHVLQTLRQPLEHGELTIHRSAGAARYPARFQLVLAGNPCPCGRAVGKGLECTCTPMARRRYLGRLSGPLLDRVDLQVDVLPVAHARYGNEPPEDSATVAARVRTARQAQARRLRGTPWATNAEASGGWLRERLRRSHGARGSAGVTVDLDRALERGRISLRGFDRALRVAWTLADLGHRDAPTRDDVSRAVLLRTRGAVG